MSTLIAKYPGRCVGCEGSIDPGDEIIYVDSSISHVECPDDLDVGTRGFCQTCFLALPETDICTNCD